MHLFTHPILFLLFDVNIPKVLQIFMFQEPWKVRDLRDFRCFSSPTKMIFRLGISRFVESWRRENQGLEILETELGG